MFRPCVRGTKMPHSSSASAGRMPLAGDQLNGCLRTSVERLIVNNGRPASGQRTAHHRTGGGGSGTGQHAPFVCCDSRVCFLFHQCARPSFHRRTVWLAATNCRGAWCLVVIAAAAAADVPSQVSENQVSRTDTISSQRLPTQCHCRHRRHRRCCCCCYGMR